MPIRRMTDAEFVVELKLQREESRVEIERLRAKVERLRKTKGEMAKQVANMAVRNTDLTLEVERLRVAIGYVAKCAHEHIATKVLAKLLEDALSREDGAP